LWAIRAFWRADETGTVAMLGAHGVETINPKTAEDDVRIVNSMGDGLPVEKFSPSQPFQLAG